MKNLRRAISIVIMSFALLALTSCTDNTEIIKNENNNADQIQRESLKVNPAHAGGDDMDDDEPGSK